MSGRSRTDAGDLVRRGVDPPHDARRRWIRAMPSRRARSTSLALRHVEAVLDAAGPRLDPQHARARPARPRPSPRRRKRRRRRPTFAGSAIWSTEPYLASIRSSVGESASVTQTEPSPTASPPGCTPTPSLRVTSWDRPGRSARACRRRSSTTGSRSPNRSSAVRRAGTWPVSSPLAGSRNATESGSARARAGVAQDQQGGDADRAREQDRTEGAEDTWPGDDPPCAGPHGPRWRSESRIVREDRALELLQLLARF